MPTLNLSNDARKFLENLPPKQFKQVAGKVFALMANPDQHDVRPLVGYALLRADIGEYRIIFDVEGDQLNVFLIGNRNDDEVYRVLKRKMN